MDEIGCEADAATTSGVEVGAGNLAGKGVYAARDFGPGEIVVEYCLIELTQAEFDALPAAEREWTHSFWGRIYLFRPPARYVNHSLDPNTVPDLDRRANVALRPIAAGESVTIDDRIELKNELETFLIAYRSGIERRDGDRLSRLLADDVIFSSPGSDSARGRSDALARLDDEWTRSAPVLGYGDATWLLASHWTSVCTCRCTATQEDGDAWVEERTSVLRRIDGSWRLLHEHSTRSDRAG